MTNKPLILNAHKSAILYSMFIVFIVLFFSENRFTATFLSQNSQTEHRYKQSNNQPPCPLLSNHASLTLHFCPTDVDPVKLSFGRRIRQWLRYKSPCKVLYLIPNNQMFPQSSHIYSALLCFEISSNA